MSIEFARSYKTTDGKCHGTLAEAQKHELTALFAPAADERPLTAEEAAHIVVENSHNVMRCLTLNENSRPKARGAKKPRKSRITEPATTTAA